MWFQYHVLVREEQNRLDGAKRRRKRQKIGFGRVDRASFDEHHLGFN
jgi:hypothetical protein